MPGAQVWQKLGEVVQRVQNFSYKMTRFLGSNVKLGEYKEQYCIRDSHVAKREVNINVSQHKKTHMVIM